MPACRRGLEVVAPQRAAVPVAQRATIPLEVASGASSDDAMERLMPTRPARRSGIEPHSRCFVSFSAYSPAAAWVRDSVVNRWPLAELLRRAWARPWCPSWHVRSETRAGALAQEVVLDQQVLLMTVVVLASLHPLRLRACLGAPRLRSRWLCRRCLRRCRAP